MKELKIDAFLVPHNDMYFNEITAPYHNRLEWVTGFTGSAGFAIIFEKSAVIFTDGRYSIQIQKEVQLCGNESIPSKWISFYILT